MNLCQEISTSSSQRVAIYTVKFADSHPFQKIMLWPGEDVGAIKAEQESFDSPEPPLISQLLSPFTSPTIMRPMWPDV